MSRLVALSSPAMFGGFSTEPDKVCAENRCSFSFPSAATAADSKSALQLSIVFSRCVPTCLFQVLTMSASLNSQLSTLNSCQSDFLRLPLKFQLFRISVCQRFLFQFRSRPSPNELLEIVIKRGLKREHRLTVCAAGGGGLRRIAKPGHRVG
jgi:hypothetical protein